MFQPRKTSTLLMLSTVLVGTLAAGCDLTTSILPPQGDCVVDSDYKFDCRADDDLPLRKD